MKAIFAAFVLAIGLSVLSCGAADSPRSAAPVESGAEVTDAATGSTGSMVQPADTDEVELLKSFTSVPGLDRAWTGDLDAIIERGYLRALVTYSKTHYFLDGARQRGISYEALVEFERFLNQRLGMRHIRVEVLILPVRRDELLAALERGLGDLAAANLTITPERLKRVDFSMPAATIPDRVIHGALPSNM